MFTKSYISANPHVFLDTAWINISALQSFLEARDRGDFERDTILIPSSSPERVSDAEFGASDVSSMDLTVKSEPTSVPLPFRTRSLTEGDREVIELLSDPDEDDEAPKNLLPRPDTVQVLLEVVPQNWINPTLMILTEGPSRNLTRSG
ncbi:hypothetical protein B0H10DRAFT_828115 [Mycena sp. CBHHK59/15]|nr:hypothetical protein B0H10DRAFT_828115 [Mycena sp. CBHHK59/15]